MDSGVSVAELVGAREAVAALRCVGVTLGRNIEIGVGDAVDSLF